MPKIKDKGALYVAREVAALGAAVAVILVGGVVATRAGLLSYNPQRTPTASSAQASLIRPSFNQEPWSCSGGYVALTFDDGPSALTEPLVAALGAARLRATFFMIGEEIQDRPDVVRSAWLNGHDIENHSWSHVSATGASTGKAPETAAQITDQMKRTSTLITSLGLPAPRFYRPPYGDQNALGRSLETQLGLVDTAWTVDSFDWKVTEAQLLVNVRRLKANDIVLFHEKETTLQTIPRIAAELEKAHLCPGRLVPSTTVREAWPSYPFAVDAAPWTTQ